MRELRHDARDDRHLQLVEDVRVAENRNGIEARIRKDDFVSALSGRVAIKDSCDIRREVFADLRNAAQKFQRNLLRLLARLREFDFIFRLSIAQSDGDLLVEAERDVLDDHGKIIADVVDAIGFVLREARIGHAHELIDEFIDDLRIRLVEDIELVDWAAVPVVLKDGFCDVVDGWRNQVFHAVGPPIRQIAFFILYAMLRVRRLRARVRLLAAGAR